MPYTSTPPGGVQGLEYGNLVAHLEPDRRAGQAGTGRQPTTATLWPLDAGT